jgi:hypothetical protein
VTLHNDTLESLLDTQIPVRKTVHVRQMHGSMMTAGRQSSH